MKTITQSQYYQLLGLFMVHCEFEARRATVEKMVADVVGEKGEEGGYFGHVSDCLHDNASVDTLLEKLGLEVADNA